MNLMNFAQQHLLQCILAYVVYSTCVDAMPEPNSKSSPFYLWLYRVGHTLAGNLVTAFSKVGRTPWPGEVPGNAQPPADPKP